MSGRDRSLPIAVLALALAAATSLPALVRAHPLSFGVLDVRERGDGRIDIDFHYSGDEANPGGATVDVPEGCALDARLRETQVENGIRIVGSMRCPSGIEGKTLRITGLSQGGSDVVVRVRRATHGEVRGLLTPSEPSFVVPSTEHAQGVLRRYIVLGVEHIALGLDHLLFVLGLFLLVDGARRLVATITAFTLGHSLTLALAALSIVRVPTAPTEACIALSIVVVATQLARGEAQSPARRRPWLIASSFGLLHGLGFAGALAEVGLPDDAIPAALFGFNLGVEIGQLAFVAVLVAATAIARKLANAERRRFVRDELMPRLLGTIATYFLCERLVALVT